MYRNFNNCIFCEKKLNEENTSIEHIIPKTLCPLNKLTIQICSECNSFLSREIEQPALPELKNAVASLKMEGYKINLGRRAKKQKEFILDSGLAVFPNDPNYPFMKVNNVLNVEKQKKIWNLSQISKNLPNFEKHEKFAFILNVPSNTDMVQHFFFKILYEITVYFFGANFNDCVCARGLKEKILNKKPHNFIKIDDLSLNNEQKNLENIAVEVPWENPLIVDDNDPNTSAFDNTPHITFAIIKDPYKRWISLLNLFGKYEFTYFFIGISEKIREELEKAQGIIKIIETTGKKRIIHHTYNSYIKSKNQNSKK